jgi:probable HAF family extracellular repeat protein
LPFSVNEANTINNSGQVIGNEPQTGNVVILDSAGLHDLGALGDVDGVNNYGEIAGHFSSDVKAFVYGAAGFQDLNTLIPANSGWQLQQAKGINDSRQITGYSTHNGEQRAYLYSNGSVTEIGTLGGNGSGGNAINNLGQIVGSAATVSEDSHAFLYDPIGGMIDLGALGNGQSEAMSLNDHGHVVGYFSFDGNSHAFLYDGSMQDLGTINGDATSLALDINNSGQIVGLSDSRAMLYENNVMHDLNELIPNDSGWILRDARSINDAGQIVGRGELNGDQTWFLLTPTSATSIGSNITVESNGTVVTFSNVIAAGNTVVAPIIPASAGAIPGGYELLGTSDAYEVSTTAAISGPITIGFEVPAVNDPTVFSSLRVLHNEGSVLVDRTILPPDSPTHDFLKRTIYARVDSLSPFVIARVGYSICPLYDQTKVHRSGSTIPIKLQLCGPAGTNLSSANVAVVATGVSLASTNASGVIDDSGDANPDFNFRYSAELNTYIFNLNTRGYGTGTYNLHFRAGTESVTHTVQFQVK